MNNDFTPWLEDQIQVLLSAETKHDLLRGIEKTARLLGFDYYSYGIRLSFPLSYETIDLVDNYPKKWHDLYRAENYLSIDPTVLHGKKTIEPVLWSESLFSNARPLWEGANSFGLTHGWAQSLHGIGGITGMLTLSRSGEAISKNELLRLTPLCLWFNQLTHAGLAKYLRPNMEHTEVRLTPREAEIMHWTAEGKTAHEISIILGIGQSTVTFHLNNVMQKLNVNNKIAATVQVVLKGLI